MTWSLNYDLVFAASRCMPSIVVIVIDGEPASLSGEMHRSVGKGLANM